MTEIQLRRGLAADWVSANPVLGAGEPGVELDTGKFKIGDGSSPWVSLLYATDHGGIAVGEAVTGGVASSVLATDALNQLAMGPTVAGLELKANRDVPNGYPSLDGAGLIRLAELPAAGGGAVSVGTPSAYPANQLPTLLLTSYRQSTDTDWGPAIVAAYAAALALGSAIIEMPPGALTVASGMPLTGINLTPNTATQGWIIFRGQGTAGASAGGTTITETSTVSNLVTAPGSPSAQFAKFGWIGCKIDSNAVPTTFAGTQVFHANGALNISQIIIDVETQNGKTPAASFFHQPVAIGIQTPAGTAPSSVTFTGVPLGTYVAQDIYLNGIYGDIGGCGLNGLTVTAFAKYDQPQGASGKFTSPITANVYIDRIFIGAPHKYAIVDCRGRGNGLPTGANPGSGAQTGGDGISGTIRVFLVAKHSDDVNFEGDEPTDLEADIVSINPWNNVLIADNFGNSGVQIVEGQWVSDAESAQVTLRLRAMRTFGQNAANGCSLGVSGKYNSKLPNLTLDVVAVEYALSGKSVQPVGIIGCSPRKIEGSVKVIQKFGTNVGRSILLCTTNATTAVTVGGISNQTPVPVVVGATVTGPGVPNGTVVAASPAPTATTFSTNNAIPAQTAWLAVSQLPQSNNWQMGTGTSASYVGYGMLLSLTGHRCDISKLHYHHEFNGTVDAAGHAGTTFDIAALNIGVWASGSFDIEMSTSAKITRIDTVGANTITANYRGASLFTATINPGGNAFTNPSKITNTTTPTSGANQDPSTGTLTVVSTQGWPQRGTFTAGGHTYSYTSVPDLLTISGIRGPSASLANSSAVNFVSGSLATDYLDDGQSVDVLTVSGSNVLVAPGADVGVSEAATLFQLVWLQYGGNVGGQVGPLEDYCIVSPVYTPGSGSFTGAMFGVMGKWSEGNIPGAGASTFLHCYVADSGTNTFLFLDKVIGGVRTSLLTAGAGGAIAVPGGAFACGNFTTTAVAVQCTTRLAVSGAACRARLVQQGNQVAGHYLNNQTTLPAVTSTPSNTTGTITLTGSDALLFGDHALGYTGMTGVMADPTAKLASSTTNSSIAVQYCNVWGGRLRHIAMQTTGFASLSNGITFQTDGSQNRVRGHFLLDNCDWTGLLGVGSATPTEISWPTAALAANDLRQYVYARKCAMYQLPASITGAATAGVAVVNPGPFKVEGFLYSVGALTTPFIQVTRRAQPNGTGGTAPVPAQVAGVSGERSLGALMPGDSFVTTGAGGTYQFIPTEAS